MTPWSLLPLCAALLFAGCTSQTPTREAGPTAPPSSTTTSPPRYSSETLSDLLVAEVAAQRQALGVTLGYYSKAARATTDTTVIGQAAQLASYLEDHQQALALSQQWLEQSPTSEDALGLAILSEIRLGNTDKATTYLDTLLGNHGPESLGRLVSQARGLDAQGNLQLVQSLAQLTDRYPDQAPLWYARAVWQQHQGNLQQALQADQQALDLMPGHEDALLLKARLLHQLGEPQKALRHLKKVVNKHPQARRPRIAYVRLLLAEKQIDRAEKQLALMSEQHPDDLDLKFSLALLALEAGATDTARQQLHTLLAQGYRPDEIHLYLGQAAEQQSKLQLAIDHYLQVEGPQAMRTRVQAARLMIRQGNNDQAQTLLARLRRNNPALTTSLAMTEAEILNSNGNSAAALALLTRTLANHPNDTQLLYSRATLAEQTGDLVQMEADLKKVLRLAPDDANALNALGYTLANHNLRLNEALDYISRALALRPDDPAILDSMGWVLYRQGNLKKARDYLRRAYEKFPDPEVAAHYGEVLWVLGAHNQAREIWRDVLLTSPDATHIRETMERLGAQL